VKTPRVKLVPPRLPASHVRRPALERLLDEAERRRLTSIVAGPGFGKSTLAASVAAERGWRWYLVDGGDRSAASFARGLADALGLELDATGAETLVRALDEGLKEDRVLVIDDVHELGAEGPSVVLLENLARQGPPELHLVLCSRDEPPFPIERLRGQGQVLDVNASMLSFSADETAQVIASSEPELSSRVHSVTVGWPVAIQLSAALFETLPEGDRMAAVDELTSARGPLFRYLAEEVLDRERPELVRLLQTAALFEIFNRDLCAAVGVGDAIDRLAEVERRGFVSTSSERGGFLRLHDLLRGFLRDARPLAEPDRIAVLRVAAGWFEEQDLIPEALRAWTDIDDYGEITRVISDMGWELFHQGGIRSDVILSAAARLPPPLLQPEVKLRVALAHGLRGEHHAELLALRELIEDGGECASSAAFHVADHESQWGDIHKAVELFLGPASEHPLSLAFASGAHLALGRPLEARICAERALVEATDHGFVSPTAEAHLNLGEVWLAEGDFSSAAAEFDAALDGTVVAGNVLGECSARYRFGELELARGNYGEALAATEETLNFAERIGFALFNVHCRKLRGEILLCLGRLDEAAADFAAARFAPGLGDVHRERGELAQARAAYEAGIREGDRTGRLADRVRARGGLARVLVSEDARASEVAAIEAIELDTLRQPVALLARGWSALAAGDTATASKSAAGAAAAARSKGNRPGLAEALELQAFCSEPCDLATLEQALAIWRELGAEVAAARVQLALARLSGNGLEADRAERELTRLGVRATAARAAGILLAIGPEEPVPIAVQTLGGFRLLREGAVVPPKTWQSKKARDLLKLLAARRGHPVARDELIEALWPEEDPARTANRLSVALSTLRSVLDPQREFAQDRFILAEAGALRLSLDAVELDVESFLETADSALRAWRSDREDALSLLEAAEGAYTGDFLAEDRYEEWAEPLRKESLAVYVEVLRALAEATGAAKYFLRIIERDRYDEQAHLGLVCALAAAGAHGEARRAYRSYMTSMQEIGAEPVAYPERAAAGAAQA
jgi:DNA-binding SARP family transcriptional activator